MENVFVRDGARSAIDIAHAGTRWAWVSQALHNAYVYKHSETDEGAARQKLIIVRREKIWTRRIGLSSV